MTGIVSPFARRSSGVLLHLTSLPTGAGHGDLGPSARSFAEQLAAMGMRWWQLLPVGIPGACDSPYDSPSAYAGNPHLISLEDLATDGLLEGPVPAGEGGPANYEVARKVRDAALRAAFQRFLVRPDRMAALQQFRHDERDWLEDYALFRALKAHFQGAPWWEWTTPLRQRHGETLGASHWENREEITYYCFEQFLFRQQWDRFRKHCNALGVQLLGDVPMFVSWDSADVWAHQNLFELDKEGQREVLAGVPPDAFSSTGQLWGNPLYRWDNHRSTGYYWWLRRLQVLLQRCDAVRVDHFIGLHRVWRIPAHAQTAMEGEFQYVPGGELLEAAQRWFPGLPLLAEDLGVVTPEVTELRRRFGLPGMRILEFAFDTDEPNDYLPHRYSQGTVAYTGTHDNDTLVGWFHEQGQTKEEREHFEARRARFQRYLAPTTEPLPLAAMRLLLASAANTVIFPLQDLAGLDGTHRMNQPGTTVNNWAWRMRGDELPASLITQLRLLNETYERTAPLPPR